MPDDPRYVNATVIDFRKKAGAELWIEACVNATRSGWVDGCFVDFCGWGLPERDYPGFTEAHNQAMKDLTEALRLADVAVLVWEVGQLGACPPVVEVGVGQPTPLAWLRLVLADAHARHGAPTDAIIVPYGDAT